MLELVARDVMTTEVTTICQDVPVEELIHLFRVSHFSGIPVVDADGRAVGLVSETDVLRALAYTVGPPGSGEFATNLQKGKRRISSVLLDAVIDPGDVRAAHVLKGLLARPVLELMTPVVHACRPEAPIVEVCEMMVWKEIRRVIVTDQAQRVVGMISSIDLIRRMGEALRQEQRDLEGGAKGAGA